VKSAPVAAVLIDTSVAKKARKYAFARLAEQCMAYASAEYFRICSAIELMRQPDALQSS
jgi:hypothetical protein